MIKLKAKIGFPDFISSRIVWFGIILAALFWVLESAADSHALHLGSFTERSMTLDFHEFWMRLFIVALLVSFSSYIQFITGKRKRAEVALKTNKSLFRTTLYNIGDAVITVDKKGKILQLNPAAEKLTGWKESTAINNPLEKVFIIINEESRKKIENPVAKILREGIIVGLANQTLLISRSGKEIPIVICGAVIRNEKGEIDGVVLVFRNQTEERKAQRQIEEARIFAESVIDTIRESLVVLDDKLKVISANRSFYQTYKVDEKNTVGKYIYELCDRLWDTPRLRELLENILPQNTSLNNYETEHTIPETGHRIMLLNARRIYGSVNKAPMILLAIEDITERRQTEKALQSSSIELQSIFDASPIPLIVVNSDRRVLKANHATQMFTGQTEQEMLGRRGGDVFRCLHALDVPEGCGFGPECKKCVVRNTVLESFRTKKPAINIETELTLLTGEKYTVRNIRFSTSYFEGDSGPRVVVALEDITDRKQAQEKLERALESAEQGEKVKSLFIANMSHEIRTPLNAILGFTELIESSTRHLVSDEEKEFFDVVRNNGKRLMSTVHEILDISQIEAGAYKMHPETFDLYQLVNEIVSEYKRMASNKGLKLDFPEFPDSAFIHADYHGLALAIRNIIDNAVKYTEQGKITILLKQNSGHYILIIRDTGIGIAEEYLENLFEAFTQESEGYTKEFQGIGLGMAIAKRHLDLNKVTIEVSSTKGVGTTVLLTFEPAAPPIPEEPDIKETQEKPMHEIENKPIVLFVEDNPDSQKLMKLYLKQTHVVHCAVSVNEAKRQLEKYPIDLVLLDLSLMGDEDGLSLVRWMRKTEAWKNTPVIAVTAHAFTSDRENCLTAGCNGYLSKPITRQKLTENIRKFL